MSPYGHHFDVRENGDCLTIVIEHGPGAGGVDINDTAAVGRHNFAFVQDDPGVFFPRVRSQKVAGVARRGLVDLEMSGFIEICFVAIRVGFAVLDRDVSDDEFFGDERI